MGGLNLHRIVRGAITAVNPDEMVVVSESTGYTTSADGTPVPSYNSYQTPAQLQPPSGKDLKQIDGLNLQGTLRSVYFYGDVEAIVRSLKKGGDKFTRCDGSVWLVNQVLETWDPGWCKVIATLQNGE